MGRTYQEPVMRRRWRSSETPKTPLWSRCSGGPLFLEVKGRLRISRWWMYARRQTSPSSISWLSPSFGPAARQCQTFVHFCSQTGKNYLIEDFIMPCQYWTTYSFWLLLTFSFWRYHEWFCHAFLQTDQLQSDQLNVWEAGHSCLSLLSILMQALCFLKYRWCLCSCHFIWLTNLEWQLQMRHIVVYLENYNYPTSVASKSLWEKKT